MNRYIALQKIIEIGSFTKAAETLGYTQSSISQMISALEDELSIKLLHRSRLGVKLTLEGSELYPFIERTILQYSAMLEKVNEIKGLGSGVIRIGTISSITCHWLPTLMKDFQILYPSVQFVLHQGDYTSIADWIRIGAIDFGFVSPAAVTGLDTVLIKEGRMLAILPQSHRLALEGTIRLNDIANEPFILLEEGHYSEPLEMFHACALEPNVKFRMHDDYAIMTMVEAGLGISILAELVLRRTNYDIVLLPTDPPINRALAIGYKNKNILPIASKCFIDFLIANIEKLP